MIRAAVLLALFLSATSAWAAVDKAAVKREVAALEDQFCAMAREKGVLAAFQHFAAPDVAFLDVDPRQLRGRDAVLARMKDFPKDATLTWSATFTDVSDDATLTYNYGRYELRAKGPDGTERTSGGWFLTIWKKQPDGSWRYVMDNGTPDRPAPKKS